MSEGPPTVLIVDDEFLIGAALSVQVEALGLKVCGTAGNADRAIALAQELRPNLVLMDMRLPGLKDGVDAATAIRGSVGSQVIFITGSREPATMDRIRAANGYTVLLKPISPRQLQEAILTTLQGG